MKTPIKFTLLAASIILSNCKILAEDKYTNITALNDDIPGMYRYQANLVSDPRIKLIVGQWDVAREYMSQEPVDYACYTYRPEKRFCDISTLEDAREIFKAIHSQYMQEQTHAALAALKAIFSDEKQQ